MKVRFGIRSKLLLFVGALLLVIFSAITFYQIKNNTSKLRADLLEQTRAFATLATSPIGNIYSIYKDTGVIRVNEQVAKFVQLNSSITNVSVFDVSGQQLYSFDQSVSPTVTTEQVRSFEPVYIDDADTGSISTVVFPYFEASGAHRFSVVYQVSDKEIEQAVRSEAISVLYFGIASLIATMALLYVLIDRLLLRPVQQVSRQAQNVSEGDLEQSIAVHGHDEIALLGDSVNSMAESLKASIAKLREIDSVKSEFMIITSHNLRTPLTIMSGYLETAAKFNSLAEIKDALSKIGASVRRLNVFAEDVLTISRFELGDSGLSTDSVIAYEFIQQIADEFAPSAELKNQIFYTEISDGSQTIEVSKPHLRSAIWNLLDNASKFTDTGGKIGLKLTATNTQVNITISDSGIGIPESEKAQLFTKFHRGTSAMQYDYAGTGIGLYASKLIVEKFGGKVQLESQQGKGSSFIITLPIANAPFDAAAAAAQNREA